MIAFVVALYSEAEDFLSKVEVEKKGFVLDKPCFFGKIEGKPFVMVISGIGKVSAALSTQYLIDTYKPDFLINFGSCGGINDSINICEYYLIKQACQFDFDITEIDNVEIGYIQEYKRVMFDAFVPESSPFLVTSLASADRFSNKKVDIDQIIKMGCLVRDMEGGAIAQVCTSNKVPFLLLKGVSDVYGYPPSTFYENLGKVCEGFYDKILLLIHNLY